MININLLPEVLRKKERMPIQHFLAICGMLLLIGLVVYEVTKYQFNILPSMRERVRKLNGEKSQLTAQVEELKELNQEISKLSDYVETVKGLYKDRIVWAKILSDIKHIVNFDPDMSTYNVDMRYLWFTKLSGKGKQIRLSGYATAATQVVAMQMPEKLLREFLSYSPVTLPEKDEEQRLQVELRQAIAEHEAQRKDNPELGLQGNREIALRQRLEEIKNTQSGGIALQPFNTMLVPGSLKLINATWTTAPRPRILMNQQLTEIFPAQAWSFDVSMELR